MRREVEVVRIGVLYGSLNLAVGGDLAAAVSFVLLPFTFLRGRDWEALVSAAQKFRCSFL